MCCTTVLEARYRKDTVIGCTITLSGLRTSQQSHYPASFAPCQSLTSFIQKLFSGNLLTIVTKSLYNSYGRHTCAIHQKWFLLIFNGPVKLPFKDVKGTIPFFAIMDFEDYVASASNFKMNIVRHCLLFSYS